MDELFGIVERITFANPDNGFTVARLRVKGEADPICIVGTLPSLSPGETVRCFGSWQVNPVHGRQFAVQEYAITAPADLYGIQKYLESGMIRGVGPVYARKIVKRFGLETLEVIDQAPSKLLEIKGLGPKKVEKIKNCWQEQRTIRDVMLFLQSQSISPAYAHRIFRKYGAESIPKVRENPYRLAREVAGIGFKTADAIAKKLGIGHESPYRVEAGVEFALNQLSEEGHVCYPLADFLPYASQLLEVGVEAVEPILAQLKGEQRIAIEPVGNRGTMVSLKTLYLAEKAIARHLHRICKAPAQLRPVQVEKAVAWVQERLRIQLAPQQREAVGAALSEKVVIITGGPGTGKSTITKAILAVTERLSRRLLLAAPTGRAAKRMAEITGKKAQTIHSLLEFDFKQGGFKRGTDNPLVCDLLIVDEASMIDTSLMCSLLKAVPDRARLVLVGDINQLPSVGPGSVLKDLIDSNCLPVSRLTRIYRQARGSKIVVNAHRINEGIFPDLSGGEGSDFFFVEAEEPEEVQKKILELVVHRLPRSLGLNSIEEIQVLAPMKRGVVGTEQLNAALQAQLNFDPNPLIRFGRQYRRGDKVMQIRNNYDKEVYNGDIGTIQAIDQVEQELVVSFDGRKVTYSFLDLDELLLAYAVSIHKYQGSECPCVVIPVHTTHFKMLHRNLLYTGVTRGKRLVILVGTKKAIAIAIQNNDVQKRHTALKEAVRGSSS